MELSSTRRLLWLILPNIFINDLGKDKVKILETKFSSEELQNVLP